MEGQINTGKLRVTGIFFFFEFSDVQFNLRLKR